MILPKEQVELFFKLYIPLLGYANQHDGLNKKRPLNEARDILYKNANIIRNFANTNPEKFKRNEIEIIKSWEKFVQGDFVLIRSLKKYSVFLRMGNDKSEIYGVLGLNDSPVDLALYGIGTYFENVVLLPWQDKIIWDGLMCQKPIILGKNYMHSFTEEYKKAKQVGKIIETIG